LRQCSINTKIEPDLGKETAVAERLDLNSLVLFYEVVNAKSITRASEQLRVPKSTISRKLSLLEQRLGGVLLRKGHRRLTTTELGATLYEHCRRLVTEVDSAGIDAAEMQEELRGLLRVSIPIDFGISWLSRAIGDFSLRYPEIHLEIDVNHRFVTPRDEPYDVTIHLGRLRESGLTYRRLATITRGVYANPAYLASRGAPESVEDFHKHDCIVTDQQRADGVWNMISRSNSERHRIVTVEGKIVVNNVGVARELAVAGMGLAILPNVMCKNDVKSSRLVRVLPNWEGAAVQASALMLSRKGIPNKVRAFLDFLSDRLSADSA
jgi:DNA-binding transcriptional LysR family regulator